MNKKPLSARPKTLSGWMEFAQKVHFRSIDLTLERVSEVFCRLELDLSAMTVILVGGTNGKGSSVAMLESIYQQAGFKTAAFTSPHLIHFNERYRFNLMDLNALQLIDSFNRIETARNEIPLTYFEFATLVAIDCFSLLAPDVLIMEAGMGGRLDAVNILPAECVLLTHIALDHTQWLGATRELIAYEKAGLFRADCPAICGDQSVPDSLLKYAASIGANLFLINQDYRATQAENAWDWQSFSSGTSYTDLPLPAISGAGQLMNAAGVLMAVQCLQTKHSVSEQAIRNGLKQVKISARLQQLVYQGKSVILDVAHNPDAVNVLADYLDKQECKGKTRAVLGMLGDKDILNTLGQICSNINDWFLTSLNEPRGATSTQLADELLQVDSQLTYNCYTSPTDAFLAAINSAEHYDRVVVFGSFYTVGEVLALIKT